MRTMSATRKYETTVTMPPRVRAVIADGDIDSAASRSSSRSSTTWTAAGSWASWGEDGAAALGYGVEEATGGD